MNLDNITNAPIFSLNGYVVEGKVTSVYDGDSVTIIFPFHNEFYTWKCRLSGIDTPELRTKNLKEKEYGYKVRDILREKILNKKVTINCGPFDKYGRLLTTIICIEDNCNINEWLINNKYAVKYDGGTKINWGDILK